MRVEDVIQLLYFVAAIGAWFAGQQRGAAQRKNSSPPATLAVTDPVSTNREDALVIADQARELRQLREQLHEAEQQKQALYQINSLQRSLRSSSAERPTWQTIIADGPFLLVVEDSGTDAELLRRALSRARLANEIVVVRDGQEALDFLFSTGPYTQRDASRQPELVLLDLRLPLIDGMEVLRRVRSDERTESIPVVVLTGAGSQADMIASMELGIDGYLVKSAEFDFEAFLRLMTTIGMHLLVMRAAWQHPARQENEDNHA